MPPKQAGWEFRECLRIARLRVVACRRALPATPPIPVLSGEGWRSWPRAGGGVQKRGTLANRGLPGGFPGVFPGGSRGFSQLYHGGFRAMTYSCAERTRARRGCQLEQLAARQDGRSPPVWQARAWAARKPERAFGFATFGVWGFGFRGLGLGVWGVGFKGLWVYGV